jgi:hypothetical protein
MLFRPLGSSGQSSYGQLLWYHCTKGREIVVGNFSQIFVTELAHWYNHRAKLASSSFWPKTFCLFVCCFLLRFMKLVAYILYHVRTIHTYRTTTYTYRIGYHLHDRQSEPNNSHEWVAAAWRMNDGWTGNIFFRYVPILN